MKREEALEKALRELKRQVEISGAFDDHGHALTNLKVLKDAEAALALPPSAPEAGEPTRKDLGEQLTALARQLDAQQDEHEREIGNRDQVIATLITNMRHGASVSDILKWYDDEQHLIPMVHRQLAPEAGEPTPVDWYAPASGTTPMQPLYTSDALACARAAGAAEATRWRPTHQHYMSGYYRVIARGRIEADLSPVVIYDNEKGETWVRPELDFDQTDPFVRFAPITDAIEVLSASRKERDDEVIERCAQIAASYRDSNPFPTVYGAIAATIRKLKETGI